MCVFVYVCIVIIYVLLCVRAPRVLWACEGRLHNKLRPFRTLILPVTSLLSSGHLAAVSVNNRADRRHSLVLGPGFPVGCQPVWPSGKALGW